ncbi:MAG: flagellar hook assembly protein FlgD [Chloroflexi bacterium]|nr:flagellar hook assembly protein FlgD [Chloroflexota bacterium]
MTTVQDTALVPSAARLPGAQESRERQGLGKQEFLQLLVAQLKNQDPMQPMQDREFIVQLAQFNILEQLQAMNQALQQMGQWSAMSQASSLLGKQVEATTESGQVAGQVTGVSMSKGQALVEVAGHKLALTQIIRLIQGPPEAPRATSDGKTT